MNEQPNDNTVGATGDDPSLVENIEDVLLEFDKEPAMGGESAISAAIEPAVVQTDSGVSPTPTSSPSPAPSPFGPPIANFGSDNAQLQDAPLPYGAQSSSSVAQTSPQSVAPAPSTVIQDIKPATAQASSPATAPPILSSSVDEEISDMVAAPKPASAASSAIESLLSVREKSEDKEGSKNQKDIKLPSTKKSNKAWLWVLSSAVLLLAGAAAGWFFMVKTPADQAAATYRTQAISYLESIDTTMEQFSSDIDATLTSLNDINRPVLQSTLLHSFSYSGDYQAAETLQRDVNSSASKAIDGVQALANANQLVVLSGNADTQGSEILSRITPDSTAEDKSAIYTEYVQHLEALKASIEDLSLLPEDVEPLKLSLVNGIDGEIEAYSPLMTADFSLQQTENSPDDANSSDDSDNLPTTGDVNSNDDNSETDLNQVNTQEASPADAAQATINRQSATSSIEEYLFSSAQVTIDNLRTELAIFIETLR